MTDLSSQSTVHVLSNTALERTYLSCHVLFERTYMSRQLGLGGLFWVRLIGHMRPVKHGVQEEDVTIGLASIIPVDPDQPRVDEPLYVTTDLTIALAEVLGQPLLARVAVTVFAGIADQRLINEFRPVAQVSLPLDNVRRIKPAFTPIWIEFAARGRVRTLAAASALSGGHHWGRLFPGAGR